MSAFTIGPIKFPSKKSATQAVRRILHESEIDVPLSGESESLVRALYSMHPRRNGEPSAFCVGINDFAGSLTRGFHAIMADGNREPFSYLPCLSPSVDAPRLTDAARAAIMLSQREALRNTYAGRALIPCKFCGAGVMLSDAQVHHMHPKFRDILDGFVGLIGLPQVATAKLGDDFVSGEIKRRWVLFHDAVSQRVVLCAACNHQDERISPDAAA